MFILFENLGTFPRMINATDVCCWHYFFLRCLHNTVLLHNHVVLFSLVHTFIWSDTLPYLVGVGCWCHKFLLSIPEYLLTKLSSTCPNSSVGESTSLVMKRSVVSLCIWDWKCSFWLETFHYFQEWFLVTDWCCWHYFLLLWMHNFTLRCCLFLPHSQLSCMKGEIYNK